MGDTRAAAICEGEREAFVETIWMTLHWPAPLVIFASPRGCPNFASAAAETKIGIGDLCPRIEVDGSQWDTARNTRGWKKNLEKALIFSLWAAGLVFNDENRDVCIDGCALTDLIVGRGGVVGICFIR